MDFTLIMTSRVDEEEGSPSRDGANRRTDAKKSTDQRKPSGSSQTRNSFPPETISRPNAAAAMQRTKPWRMAQKTES